MPQTRYERYLKSEHWLRKRRSFLGMRRRKQLLFCDLCESDKGLHVHHRSYKRLGRERLKDLTLLCKTCHFALHALHPPLPLWGLITRIKRLRAARAAKRRLGNRQNELLTLLIHRAPSLL